MHIERPKWGEQESKRAEMKKKKHKKKDLEKNAAIHNSSLTYNVVNARALNFILISGCKCFASG